MICEWWGETYWDIRKVLQHPPHQKITDIKKMNALAFTPVRIFDIVVSIYVQYIIYSRQYTNHIIWFDILHLWTLLYIYIQLWITAYYDETILYVSCPSGRRVLLPQVALVAPIPFPLSCLPLEDGVRPDLLLVLWYHCKASKCEQVGIWKKDMQNDKPRTSSQQWQTHLLLFLCSRIPWCYLHS